jgi:hypothetical protein
MGFALKRPRIYPWFAYFHATTRQATSLDACEAHSPAALTVICLASTALGTTRPSQLGSDPFVP